MVQMLGFAPQEETLVTDMMARFEAGEYMIGELARVEKRDLPGYNGKVVPARVGASDRMEMTMLLSCLGPFTIAHELAHVSDISTRRREALDNLSMAMPSGWHLAHRMSAEYYANRVACDHAAEPEIFAAFQSDSAGFKVAAHQGDWAATLIHYALLLGIVHGMKRLDCDPLKLLGAAVPLPQAVRDGIDGFRRESVPFFDGYGAAPLALAA
jgi:hypothetical protein